MGDYLGSVRNYYDHLTEFNGPPEGMFVMILKILLWSRKSDKVIIQRIKNLVTAYEQVNGGQNK
ncbi:hypothetical protein ERICIV_02460 [Paenibacillus larvae subsp. larvae]|uniref:Uncharacterized protein n=1 Tax=Paenibacillus larvae subsp. larvae TaxID=147375 RepID=A0A2L1U151_9BACL|nr:hypothetical protein [Paenibacillus larvae]AQZ48560.1 hypothetical protein B5S25_20265 [Paenibacillus larvae subsp. pulvifaciens]AVF26634.1 hypothetical protein ERICIII_02484 [Paenibacillus larvae subsp. larvae]AVF31368.1 hypothetical protein ERICIV_02460 [Paenibacillus larvae subsp. larvae]MBH0343555.1 hypothetical protein [Paenibacillus larvae]MCY7521743.1 hypothetical protein [Paenibacillus larvae]